MNTFLLINELSNARDEGILIPKQVDISHFCYLSMVYLRIISGIKNSVIFVSVRDFHD